MSWLNTPKHTAINPNPHSLPLLPISHNIVAQKDPQKPSQAPWFSYWLNAKSNCVGTKWPRRVNLRCPPPPPPTLNLGPAPDHENFNSDQEVNDNDYEIVNDQEMFTANRRMTKMLELKQIEIEDDQEDEN